MIYVRWWYKVCTLLLDLVYWLHTSDIFERVIGWQPDVTLVWPMRCAWVISKHGGNYRYWRKVKMLDVDMKVLQIIPHSTRWFMNDSLEMLRIRREAVRITVPQPLLCISQEIYTRFRCALLCCGYVIVHNELTWSIYPYSSGLLCWHWGNR